LYEHQRREAEGAKALLAFTAELRDARSVAEICALTVGTAATMFATDRAALWLGDSCVASLCEELWDGPSAPLAERGRLVVGIGKIGILSEILRKPGPLTDEEFQLVKEHPVLGARILAPIDRLSDVRPIVRAAHERWDGKGYPDGVEGDRIPLESRIVFVCDA